MHRFGVKEWLVLAVMSMQTVANTVVRTIYGNSHCFAVKVGMHQGSALSPLLFMIVMKASSGEFRVTLPWELLYVDDLVVIAETEDDLIKRFNKWKDNEENRGIRVGMNKTNKWLQDGHVICVIEVLVVIQYSVLVVKSGYTRKGMSNVMKSFICRGCGNPVTGTGCTSVDISVSINLELVDKFCYLGDMLIVDGDAGAAMEMLMQLWSSEFELDGINSGTWYHCLPVKIYH